MFTRESVRVFWLRLCRGIRSCCLNRGLRNLFLLALVLRLVLFWEGCHQAGIEKMAYVTGDVTNYMKMADAVLTGAGDAEKYFFTFGPGHAYYLAALIKILGNNLYMIVLLNILLSSLSVLLVYKIGKILTGSTRVGIVSGLLIATSYTAITLSCTLLSETFYYFLFAAGTCLYLIALERQKWLLHALAGLLVGFAALTRSMGQFFPFVMLVIGLIHYRQYRPQFRAVETRLARKALYKIASSAAIAIVVIGLWVLRNAVVVGVPAVTMSGEWGVVKIASHVREDIENRPAADIRRDWISDELTRLDKSSLSPKEAYNLGKKIRIEMLGEYPAQMLKTYLYWTWRNVTEISYYHRMILPDFKRTMISWEYKIKDLGLNYICFALSMVALVLLLIRRRWYVASVLFLVYAYHVPIVGFSTQQGSRIFYPASVAWATMIAILLVSIGSPLVKRISSLCVGPDTPDKL